MQRYHFACCYGGTIVTNENGPDYDGGIRRHIVLKRGSNFKDLLEKVVVKFGIDQKLHKTEVIHRFAYSKTASVGEKFFESPIEDEDDFEGLLQYTEDMERVPELFIVTVPLTNIVNNGPSLPQLERPCLPTDPMSGPDYVSKWQTQPSLEQNLHYDPNFRVMMNTGTVESCATPAQHREVREHVTFERSESSATPTQNKEVSQLLPFKSGENSAPPTLDDVHVSTEQGHAAEDVDVLDLKESEYEYGSSEDTEFDPVAELEILKSMLPDNNELTWDQKFKSKDDLEFHVRLLHISNRKVFKVKESGPKKWEVRCVAYPKCGWKLRARVKKREDDWTITGLSETGHTCVDTLIGEDHPCLTSSLMSRFFIHRVKYQPDVKVKELCDLISGLFRYQVKLDRVYDARNLAIKAVYGRQDEANTALPAQKKRRRLTDTVRTEVEDRVQMDPASIQSPPPHLIAMTHATNEAQDSQPQLTGPPDSITSANAHNSGPSSS